MMVLSLVLVLLYGSVLLCSLELSIVNFGVVEVVGDIVLRTVVGVLVANCVATVVAAVAAQGVRLHTCH